MISKEEFIERATSVVMAIKKFENIKNNAERVIGSYCFDNICDTGLIPELIDCLAATIEDKEDWVRWVICEHDADFPIYNSIWVNGKLTKINGWGDIYDLVQIENGL